MKKTSLLLFLSLLSTTCAMAQSKFNISGTIIEKGSKEAIPSASVRVLSLPDSSMVTGASTGIDGTFKIQNVKKGKYALKVTFIGYQDHTISLDLTNKKDKTVDVGYLTLIENSKMLKDAVVSAAAAQVQVSGDSLVYNASAFRTAEGSALEELVKKLPGAEIDDDGNVTINGKSVKKILVDGKEFFLNDKSAALKNIPTNIIDKIKAYDRKSDLARVTGIDDGEDETVLDLQVKKGMNQGWMGNLDLGMGTEHRYSERLYLMRMLSDKQITVLGGANNTGDRGFGGGGGRGGWGRGGNGLAASKNIGTSFATTNDKLETGGSAMFRYNGNDTYSESNTHSFVSKGGAFSNRIGKNISSNINANLNFRLEWKPDSMTNIIFRPSGSLSRNRGRNRNDNATYNTGSEESVTSRLNYAIDHILDADTLFNYIINTNASISQSYSLNKNLNGELQINRRLNNNGRNITFRATGGYSDSESKQLSASSIKYRNTMSSQNNNRYYLTPNESFNYALQATYSEPIAYKTYLQFSYRFNYSYSKSDRQASVYGDELSTYNTLSQALSIYRYDIAGALDYMLSNNIFANNDAKTDSIANRLSQFSEYRNFNHTIGMNLRKVTDMYNLSVGFELLPQNSTLNYKYMGQEYPEVKRTVFNFSPNMDFRYNFDKQTQLRVNYRGRTSQPSMENLLDITDDSDPLNITKGNPGLKPSFSHNLQFNYNTYNADLQQGIFTFGNASLTQNSISNETRYDAVTGVTTTRPENINGNWNGMVGFGYNRGLGANKYFTVSSFTNFNYNHNVSYYFLQDSTTLCEMFPDEIYLASNAKENTPDSRSIKTATNTIGVNQRLSFGYRKDWFEISANGNVNYNHSRNNIVKNNNLDTWNFSYGMEMNLNFDNGLSFSTDISESSRRGYSSSDMNTDELLWNAQLSYSFLKGKALTISAQWNDILQQRSNISRTLSAMQSSDQMYNSIYSYGMVRVIYKLNIFGKGTGGFGGFGGGMPGGFVGGRPGGFGGGRPGGRR